jgi:hypothetical protein
MLRDLRPKTTILLMFLALAGCLATSPGCADSGGGTVQPPPVVDTPETAGPVDEPPSTDEK